MENAGSTGREGFACSMSMSHAAATVAWAIAVKKPAPHDEPRVRWLFHPDISPLMHETIPGEVIFWLADVLPSRDDGNFGPTALVLRTTGAILDAQEHGRLSRLLHSEDRRSYLAAHAGARLILGRAVNRPPEALQFRSSANHKPALCGDVQDIDFSISHARGAVAVAAARMPVGVDVEPLREIANLEAMIDLVLAPEEQATLRTTPKAFRSRHFLRYWTLKEALLKAAGLGFAVSPNTVTIDAGPAPRVLAVPAVLGSAAQWRLIAPSDISSPPSDCHQA